MTSERKWNQHRERLSREFMLCEAAAEASLILFSRFNKNLCSASGRLTHSYSNTRSRERLEHCCAHPRTPLARLFLPIPIHVPSEIATDFNNIFLSYFSATSFININCHVHNVKCFLAPLETITFRFFYYRHRHLEKYFLLAGIVRGGFDCCNMRGTSHSGKPFAMRDALNRIALQNAASSSSGNFISLYFRYFMPHFYYVDPICMSVCHLLRCCECARGCVEPREVFATALNLATRQSIYSWSINSNRTHVSLCKAQIYELSFYCPTPWGKTHRETAKRESFWDYSSFSSFHVIKLRSSSSLFINFIIEMCEI